MMVVNFTESLTEIISSFLLSSTSFQEQCREIGYGMMLSDYMQCTRYVCSLLESWTMITRFLLFFSLVFAFTFHFFVLISSKLIGNVCSKIQVLLDRYTTLNKSMKQQTVLNESTSGSPYNYGIQTIFLFCYLPLLFTFYLFPHIHSNNHITIRLSFYSFWTRLIWLGYIPSTSVSSSLPRCIPSSSPSQSSYRCFLLLHKPWFTSGISFRRNYFKGNDSLCHGLCVIGDAK